MIIKRRTSSYTDACKLPAAKPGHLYAYEPNGDLYMCVLIPRDGGRLMLSNIKDGNAWSFTRSPFGDLSGKSRPWKDVTDEYWVAEKS